MNLFIYFLMNHQDHVSLLENGIPHPGGIWADFGSGDGAFTLALRDIAGPAVEIYSIDKDEVRLKRQQELFNADFPNTMIHYLHKDFTKPLNLPGLDGVIMANSLHFMKDKLQVLKLMYQYLKENGRFILVEYNINTGNLWIPYPIPLAQFQNLSVDVGFTQAVQLHAVPSQPFHEIYSAICYKQKDELIEFFTP